MKTYYIYILLYPDETYYTGVTSNLEKRLWQHKNSFFPNSYTSERLPVKLVYYERFNDVWNAIAREKQVKDWNQDKKKALIDGDWDKLKGLGKKNF